MKIHFFRAMCRGIHIDDIHIFCVNQKSRVTSRWPQQHVRPCNDDSVPDDMPDPLHALIHLQQSPAQRVEGVGQTEEGEDVGEEGR